MPINNHIVKFKSLPELLDRFKDEKTCIDYLTQIRWSEDFVCPHCGAKKPYKTNRGYKCSSSLCYKKFTIKTGTIFQGSKLTLRLWFTAIYLFLSHKKGVNSVQMSIDLGVTQKTSWNLLRRIRQGFKQVSSPLGEDSIVEIDETYVGGWEYNRHFIKRRSKDKEKRGLRNDNKPFVPKKMIVGLLERKGKLVLKHFNRGGNTGLLDYIKKTVTYGATICTDQAKCYNNLKNNYTHKTVNHSLKEYVRGYVTTNGIENVWTHLKRSLNGIYHSVSHEYIQSYLDEFSNRFNTRNLNPFEKFNKYLIDNK